MGSVRSSGVDSTSGRSRSRSGGMGRGSGRSRSSGMGRGSGRPPPCAKRPEGQSAGRAAAAVRSTWRSPPPTQPACPVTPVGLVGLVGLLVGLMGRVAPSSSRGSWRSPGRRAPPPPLRKTEHRAPLPRPWPRATRPPTRPPVRAKASASPRLVDCSAVRLYFSRVLHFDTCPRVSPCATNNNEIQNSLRRGSSSWLPSLLEVGTGAFHARS